MVQHRWSLKGGYCEKYMRDQTVMLMLIERHEDYFLVCLCDKNDFWASVTVRARAEEAEQRRKVFRVVAQPVEVP